MAVFQQFGEESKGRSLLGGEGEEGRDYFFVF